MAYLMIQKVDRRKVVFLFSIQLILNIAWNPIFFYYQSASMGLLCISLLTITIGSLFINYLKVVKVKTFLLAPYLIWLIIATSLNLYISLYN
jgi:tryptophan-rich sensory protein